jgi:hypothetical protein
VKVVPTTDSSSKRTRRRSSARRLAEVVARLLPVAGDPAPAGTAA